MKELTKEFQDNEIAIVSEAEQKKNLELLRKERKIRGHILWEYNTQTKELIPAKFRPLSIMISAGVDKYESTETFEVVVNESCIYLQALNRKNAIRHLTKKNNETHNENPKSVHHLLD